MHDQPSLHIVSMASRFASMLAAYGRVWHGFDLVRQGIGWKTVQASLASEPAARGGVLVVVRHSRGMLDIALLHCALFLCARRKPPACVVHPFFFGSPLAPLCVALNCIPAGDPDALVKSMATSGLVLVAPGGSFEMFKDPCEVGKVAWSARPGFAALAVRHGWDVVPCSMSNAEYHVWSPLFSTPLPRLLRWAMGITRRTAAARAPRQTRGGRFRSGSARRSPRAPSPWRPLAPAPFGIRER